MTNFIKTMICAPEVVSAGKLRRNYINGCDNAPNDYFAFSDGAIIHIAMCLSKKKDHSGVCGGNSAKCSNSKHLKV